MAARAQNRAAKRHGRRRTARRLVHHDDARVGDKLDGDRQALALLDGQACFLLSRAIGCVVAVVVRLLGALGVAVCCLDGTAPPPPVPWRGRPPLQSSSAPWRAPLSPYLSPPSHRGRRGCRRGSTAGRPGRLLSRRPPRRPAPGGSSRARAAAGARWSTAPPRRSRRGCGCRPAHNTCIFC